VVPIGVIQSAIGGSQIEAWISNVTLQQCSNESLHGGSIPDNSGALFYGMVAPFANYSSRGFIWYQGENNAYGAAGNVVTDDGYGCEVAHLVKEWRRTWGNGGDDDVGQQQQQEQEEEEDGQPLAAGIVTLAAGTSEGWGNHMAGIRWSQTANYGVWEDNPYLPYTFGAHAYDLQEPWFFVGDGNPAPLPQDEVAEGKDDDYPCCFAANPTCRGDLCPDQYNCSLPSFETHRYGKECAEWPPESSWLQSLWPYSELIRNNSPSQIPGNNFMGGIHPRLKRPLAKRLALAALNLYRGGSSSLSSSSSSPYSSSSSTKTLAGSGPTIAGCRYNYYNPSSLSSYNAENATAAGTLVLQFNLTLLRGESLMLGSFDSNRSHWKPPALWKNTKTNPAPSPPPPKEVFDSLGLMVCLSGKDNEDLLLPGNASTCECQTWDYMYVNDTHGDDATFWYCAVGPGYKPTMEAIASERERRHRLWKATEVNNNPRLLRWVPSPNPFREQWMPAPLRLIGGGKAVVNLSGIESLNNSMLVRAVRLAWPLFDTPYIVGDTCCPSALVQAGRAVCMPGSCALYTDRSQLPANPFFAVIEADAENMRGGEGGGAEGRGRCRCRAPQSCNE